MKTFKMILIAITFIFSMNVLAGYTQPAPVEVEIDENDGSFFAGGDMLSARTAKNDVESIGCGVRKYSDHNNDWGFCQASDENDQYVFCWTQDADMLEAINVLNESSYIQFMGGADEECTHIGTASQSFYAPNTTTKGSN